MITLDVRDREVRRALNNMSRLRMDKLADAIGKTLVEQSMRRISREKRGPDGKKWEPVEGGESGGFRDRRGRFRGRGILLRSGQLLNSIEKRAEDRRVVVGSSLAYAGVHQDGDDNVDARPYLGIGDDSQREILDVVAMFLEEAA